MRRRRGVRRRHRRRAALARKRSAAGELGDIDAAGFEILDGFRADGVPAVSMLMDPATYERYERFGTSLDRRGIPLGPGTRRDLPQLDTAGRSMYHALTDPAWKRYRRIEQERIPLIDALAAIRALQPGDMSATTIK
ncbi:MAG: Wadjet anti-phage system protein JetD domain-containing protein [Streptosporangiaceae bacterium]